jgi:hypothetical protein
MQTRPMKTVNHTAGTNGRAAGARGVALPPALPPVLRDKVPAILRQGHDGELGGSPAVLAILFRLLATVLSGDARCMSEGLAAWYEAEVEAGNEGEIALA